MAEQFAATQRPFADAHAAWTPPGVRCLPRLRLPQPAQGPSEPQKLGTFPNDAHEDRTRQARGNQRDSALWPHSSPASSDR